MGHGKGQGGGRGVLGEISDRMVQIPGDASCTEEGVLKESVGCSGVWGHAALWVRKRIILEPIYE
jgi:hypothetical protein